MSFRFDLLHGSRKPYVILMKMGISERHSAVKGKRVPTAGIEVNQVDSHFRGNDKNVIVNYRLIHQWDVSG